MTYTAPEGVTIGTFTADSLPASFNAPAGSNINYKIYGTSAGAGVETENLYVVDETTRKDYATLGFSGEWRYGLSYAAAATIRLPCKSNTRYTISVDDISSITIWRVSLINTDNIPDESVTSIPVDSIITQLPQSGSNSFTTNSDSKYILFQLDKSLYDTKKIMLVEGSTSPTSYIPHGYKLPLTVETGEQTEELSVYIGDSKLSETEYVDSESGKIYKLQEGVLTPTDPPIPLPAITASGETTITTTETLGDIELTGDWLAIMGSTEQSEIEIGFTVDADSYIAMLTIDDDPTIQVFDTITIPSSAGSFTLQVVSWGREQYTDTVYNAIT